MGWASGEFQGHFCFFFPSLHTLMVTDYRWRAKVTLTQPHDGARDRLSSVLNGEIWAMLACRRRRGRHGRITVTLLLYSLKLGSILCIPDQCLSAGFWCCSRVGCHFSSGVFSPGGSNLHTALVWSLSIEPNRQVLADYDPAFLWS